MHERLRQAVTLHRQGHLARAQVLYEEILEASPDQADALHLLGVIASQTLNPARAVELISKAIQIDPGNAVAYSNRGIALQKLERWDAALCDYDQAIAIQPDLALAHCNRGNVLKELEEWDAAIASYDRAIAIDPRLAEAHSNRGAALQMRNRCAEALLSLDRALEIRPDYPDAHCNRGNVLEELGQWDAALASYDRAIALQPDHADAYGNRGLLLQHMNCLDAALESFDRAIAHRPDDARNRVNRAMARLVTGDFENGWAEYEWRHRLPDAAFVRDRRDYAQPRWTGAEPLRGRVVLLHGEQGLGDTLQFCRYAECVAALGATVILEAPAPLARLLAGVPGVSRVLASGDALPAFDFHCSLMSLPRALRTTLQSIPAQVPYLRSDPEKLRFWADRLGPKSRRRVGLVWSGGARPDRPELWSVPNRRNIPLAKLASLNHPDIEFLSLQKGQPAESELDALVAQGWDGPPIANLAHLLRDFSDTAALIEQLDLLITVDTATAHLAGALGKPVWILNRYDTCWRWLLERSDSPWYPTATLYRQERPGDWDGVVARVRSDLARARRHAPDPQVGCPLAGNPLDWEPLAEKPRGENPRAGDPPDVSARAWSFP
jgi:tetratricopeptide (TPR) repeat protein